MSANITRGLTFSTGATYTAGHFNDYLHNATIADIDRTSVNYTLGVLVTRSGVQPAGPIDKEAFSDTTPVSFIHEPVMTYTGGLFTESENAAYLFRFSSGNGAAIEGNVLQAGVAANESRAGAGISAFVTGAHIGVATTAADTISGTEYVTAKTFGLVKVRVISVVDVGNYLGPSGTNGVLRSDTDYNTERDQGSFSPTCAFQAMESSSDPSVKTIWAKEMR